MVGPIGEIDLLHVQFAADQLGVLFQPGQVRAVGQDDLDPGQRLADLELRTHAGRQAQRDDLADQAHLGREGLVDQGRVAGRVVAQMDALDGLRAGGTAAEGGNGQVLPKFLGQERHEGAISLAVVKRHS